MKRKIIFVLSLMWLWLMLSAASAQAAIITIREQADVVSAVVRLDDVADIAGQGHGERIERLGSVAVCSAPPPGESQVLSANVIVSALNASGLDLSGLNLAGFSRVLVRRKYDLISVEELSRAVGKHVAAKTGWPVGSFFVNPPKNLLPVPVSVGNRDIRVQTHAEENFQGSVLAHFQVLIGGELERTIAHRFGIERYVDAPVAIRKIPRGQRITMDDVELSKVEQSRIDKDSFTSVEQAIGLVALRTIPQGKSLGTDMAAEAPIVRRGEYRSIISAGNGFKILTRGRILEDGGPDDIVRVRLSSRKTVHAIVMDSNTLQIVRQWEQYE